jgi:hypothetical protein
MAEKHKILGQKRSMRDQERSSRPKQELLIPESSNSLKVKRLDRKQEKIEAFMTPERS